MLFRYELDLYYNTLVELGIKCLEGTTERSDSNRGRSPRIGVAKTTCLEGTTPQDRHFLQRHRRTAFQAELSRLLSPRTSSPVTIASLCTAFQAVDALTKEHCLYREQHFSAKEVAKCVPQSYEVLSDCSRPRSENSAFFQFFREICPYRRPNFPQDAFSFLGDVFHFLPESFSFPIRYFLLQSL